MLESSEKKQLGEVESQDMLSLENLESLLSDADEVLSRPDLSPSEIQRKLARYDFFADRLTALESRGQEIIAEEEAADPLDFPESYVDSFGNIPPEKAAELLRQIREKYLAIQELQTKKDQEIGQRPLTDREQEAYDNRAAQLKKFEAIKNELQDKYGSKVEKSVQDAIDYYRDQMEEILDNPVVAEAFERRQMEEKARIEQAAQEEAAKEKMSKIERLSAAQSKSLERRGEHQEALKQMDYLKNRHRQVADNILSRTGAELYSLKDLKNAKPENQTRVLLSALRNPGQRDRLSEELKNRLLISLFDTEKPTDPRGLQKESDRLIFYRDPSAAKMKYNDRLSKVAGYAPQETIIALEELMAAAKDVDTAVDEADIDVHKEALYFPADDVRDIDMERSALNKIAQTLESAAKDVFGKKIGGSADLEKAKKIAALANENLIRAEKRTAERAQARQAAKEKGKSKLGATKTGKKKQRKDQPEKPIAAPEKGSSPAEVAALVERVANSPDGVRYEDIAFYFRPDVTKKGRQIYRLTGAVGDPKTLKSLDLQTSKIFSADLQELGQTKLADFLRGVIAEREIAVASELPEQTAPAEAQPNLEEIESAPSQGAAPRPAEELAPATPAEAKAAVEAAAEEISAGKEISEDIFLSQVPSELMNALETAKGLVAKAGAAKDRKGISQAKESRQKALEDIAKAVLETTKWNKIGFKKDEVDVHVEGLDLVITVIDEESGDLLEFKRISL